MKRVRKRPTVSIGWYDIGLDLARQMRFYEWDYTLDRGIWMVRGGRR